ncbi:MAG: OmpA family protein, partial [Roseiarcus sp.]
IKRWPMIRIAVIFVAVLTVSAALAACTTTQTAEPRAFPVYFQTAKADLTPEARQVVEQAAAAMRDAGPSKIVVEGLADGYAPRDGALADRRAETVARALAAAGVDPAAIEKNAGTVPHPVIPVAAHKVMVQVVPQAASSQVEAGQSGAQISER